MRPAGVGTLTLYVGSSKRAERLGAAKGLGYYGNAAKDAVPLLGRALREEDDPVVVQELALALARIGPAALPELLGAMKDGVPAVRRSAVLALTKFGPEAKEAVPVLVFALKDSDGSTRALAAQALGEIGGEPERVVPALCLAFRDPDANVRKQAGLALVSLGATAVAGLKETLKDGDPILRRDAATVLGALGPDAKEAVPDLVGLLKDREAEVRAAGAGAVGAIGKGAAEALPLLLDLLQDQRDFATQRQAFVALRRIGSADVPGLLQKLREINGKGRWATPFVLKQFGPKAKDAVPHLVKTLGDPEVGMRLGAVFALGEIGPEAQAAIPALGKILDDPSPVVRAAVTVALPRLDPRRQAAAEKKFTDAFTQTEAAFTAAQGRLHTDRLFMDAAFAQPGRPLNRLAFADPLTQARYSAVINIFTLVSKCGDSGLGLDLLRREKMKADTARLIARFGPEAVPALVSGLNQVGTFNTGFS
jgi:HEAT repeat protein